MKQRTRTRNERRREPPYHGYVEDLVAHLQHNLAHSVALHQAAAFERSGKVGKLLMADSDT